MSKTCKSCEQTKPLEEFARHASFKDGRNSRCKACKNAEARAFYKENREEISIRKRKYDHREHDLKRKYGITRECYEQMATAQDYLCAICRRPPGTKGLVVDHCHDSGCVRGLLCGPCNLALGQLRDDTQVMANAIRYVEASRDAAVSQRQRKTA